MSLEKAPDEQKLACTIFIDTQKAFNTFDLNIKFSGLDIFLI